MLRIFQYLLFAAMFVTGVLAPLWIARGDADFIRGVAALLP